MCCCYALYLHDLITCYNYMDPTVYICVSVVVCCTIDTRVIAC